MENNTQKKQTGNGPGDESDSGESLFLTQKSVPKCLRSGRPYLLSQRSTPISQRFVEDGGLSSESESEDVLGRRKKLQPLPKYNFPFLKQRKRGSSCFSSQSNKILHYYAMGGFFNSVRELSSHDQKRKRKQPLLPTADEAEDITPLTEEEMSDEEDIKIVSKKMFVYSLQPNRTKSSHLKPQRKKYLGKVTSEKDSAKNRTQFTCNNHLGLQRNNSNQHHSVDNCDSDATLIEEPRSIAQKYVSENLTELQQSASPVSGLCPTEELDNTESQSILQNITSDITEQTDDRPCKEKRLKTQKKRKPKDVVLGDETDHQDKLVNDEIQESGVLLEDHSTKSPPGVLHYDNIQRKKTNKCIAVSGRLHNQSCNIENVVDGQKLNEDFEIPSSCLVETLNSDDSSIRKKKHKKKKCGQENVEIETGRELDPGQILNNVQLDNSNTDNLQVHEEVSELTDKIKTHKRKQKANSDNCIEQDDVSPKKHKKRLKLNEMSLPKSDESHEQPELVNLKSIATDSITTQSDESVSVRKKQKKKRRGSFVEAETVENSHLLVSQSVDGDIADALGISTSQTESAGNGGQLHEPVLELGNSVKRKKKKHRHDSTGVYNNGFDKPDALGQNTKAIEGTTISGKNKCTRNQSEECDSAEVALPQSDECEQLKQKKKKSKRHHTEISNVQQMSPSEEEEGSTIKSLNAFENQVTKKKKRKLYDDDVDEGKSEKSELEQSTVKRKKLKKDRIKHNPDVSIQSYVEMSPSSASPVKNKSQTKVKRRLYNPNDHLQEF